MDRRSAFISRAPTSWLRPVASDARDAALLERKEQSAPEAPSGGAVEAAAPCGGGPCRSTARYVGNHVRSVIGRAVARGRALPERHHAEPEARLVTAASHSSTTSTGARSNAC